MKFQLLIIPLKKKKVMEKPKLVMKKPKLVMKKPKKMKNLNKKILKISMLKIIKFLLLKIKIVK
jgi:hypothetical protein